MATSPESSYDSCSASTRVRDIGKGAATHGRTARCFLRSDNTAPSRDHSRSIPTKARDLALAYAQQFNAILHAARRTSVPVLQEPDCTWIA